MKFLAVEPDTLKFLVCRDVDGTSSSKLAEKYVPHHPIFDFIVVCGPFAHHPLQTREEVATAEGDMSSVIAQLENIVCRVVYLASETDPHSALVDQVHLTPNSVNIHARELFLTSNLRILGFTEKSSSLVDNNDNDEEDLEDVSLQSGTSVSIIHEILENASPIPSFSIFTLNYKYSHTLNQFLFHMTDDFKQAGVKLCILASENEECTRLPSKFGNLSIVGLKSLRLTGCYTVVDVQKDKSSGEWIVVKQEELSVN